jgi:hypothetical protein
MEQVFKGEKIAKDKVREWKADEEGGNQHGLVEF